MIADDQQRCIRLLPHYFTNIVIHGDVHIQDHVFVFVGPRILRMARITVTPKIMLDAICSTSPTLRVNNADMPKEVIKSRLLKLNSSHIEFVMDCMRENTTKIRNIKQYLRAVLFNAPSTIDNYYTALVAHDMASPDWGKPKSGIPDYSCSPDESL